jgi:hypothetical protein
MALIRTYLRVASAAKNERYLAELRVSTWLLRAQLNRGSHFYENVAHDADTGWVWLHHYGYCSRHNITFRTPHPSFEWSFACTLIAAHNDVTWAFVASRRAASVMSDIVASETPLNALQRKILLKASK